MARIRYFNIRIAKTANFLLHQFWECRIVYELPRWYLADSGVQVLHLCCECYDPGQMVSIMDANVSQRRWGRGCAAAGQGSQGGRDQIPQSRPSATSAATRLSPATSPIGPHTNHVCPPNLHHVWCQVASEYYTGRPPNPPKHLATPSLTPAPSAPPLHSSAHFMKNKDWI